MLVYGRKYLKINGLQLSQETSVEICILLASGLVFRFSVAVRCKANNAMTGPIDWETVAQIPALDANQVDLIAFRLDLEPEILENFRKSLSPDEDVRAGRFVFKEHRTRFVACRGALRSLLGSYLSCDPAAVSLRVGDHGKLRLANPGSLDIRFNLTHSEELAVFA